MPPECRHAFGKISYDVADNDDLIVEFDCYDCKNHFRVQAPIEVILSFAISHGLFDQGGEAHA